MTSEFAGCGQLSFFVQQLEAVTYAIVVDGQNVGSAQLEHQHHLHRPPTDATHGDETFDDRFVIQCQ